MDNKERYICNFGLGWGIAGPTMSLIRRKLTELDLTNDAGIRFHKLNELIQMQTIDVTGDKDKIIELRNFMVSERLDDRSYKNG